MLHSFQWPCKKCGRYNNANAEDPGDRELEVTCLYCGEKTKGKIDKKSGELKER